MIPSCKAMPAYIFFILLSSIFLDTEASNGNCTSIKCTHDGAPDIRFPFHVRGQYSQHRGHHGYELHCNNNTTLIHFPSYGDLVVKSISYDVRKLDLIDPKNCIHQVFLNLNLSLTPFRYYYSLKEYSYLNCSLRLSPSFTRVPCLSSSGYHVYTVEHSLSVPDSCKVVRTITVPFRYSPYLSDSSFGLRLTWDFLGQQDCEANEVQSISQIETGQQAPAKVGGYKIIPSTTMKHQVIQWEQGWSYMQAGITKLKRIIQGLPEPQFSSEDYMMLYATVYNMCTQNPPYDYSQQLYDKYRETFQDYITSTVLPSLKEKRGEFMLQEFVKSWTNHKVMVRWLSRFFHYLDRYFIADRSLVNLNEVGLNSFRDFVHRETKVDARVVVIGLINKEREGEKIDRNLLKSVINIFVEIGMGQMDAYEEDFEAHMLMNTGKYYSRKASSWVLEDPNMNYMLKAEECLRRERARVSHYLHSSSEQKLVEKVENELLAVYTTQLKHSDSGSGALARDDNVEGLILSI